MNFFGKNGTDETSNHFGFYCSPLCSVHIIDFTNYVMYDRRLPFPTICSGREVIRELTAAACADREKGYDMW